MIRLDYKPLSVNVVWQGRRFKTKKYTQYEKDLATLLLPYSKEKLKIVKDIKITYRFHMKSILKSDVDNFIKPLTDILVKNEFIIDDRYVTEYHVYKIKADSDYIEIGIE